MHERRGAETQRSDSREENPSFVLRRFLCVSASLRSSSSDSARSPTSIDNSPSNQMAHEVARDATAWALEGAQAFPFRDILRTQIRYRTDSAGNLLPAW